MPLPVITLKNLEHRGGMRIALYFDYDATLIKEIKKLKWVRWSASNKCWYTDNDEASKKEILLNLQMIAQVVDQTSCEILTTPKSKFDQLADTEKETVENYRRYLEGRRYSESTIKSYTSFVTWFLLYSGKCVDDIRTVDVVNFCTDELARKNFSISTQRQFIGAMKLLKELYVGTEFEVPENLRPHRSRILPNILSQQEVLELLRSTKNLKHRTTLALIYSCGLRISEMINMQIADIDFKRKQVKIRDSKWRKDRYVVLAESVIPILNNYLDTYRPVKYVIEGRDGNKYSAESIRGFLKRSCKEAGIRKRTTPHTLRHTYATHLLENGVDLRIIQELLGHKNPKTTMIYTRVSRKSLVEVRSPLDDAVRKMIDRKGAVGGQAIDEKLLPDSGRL